MSEKCKHCNQCKDGRHDYCACCGKCNACDAVKPVEFIRTVSNPPTVNPSPGIPWRPWPPKIEQYPDTWYMTTITCADNATVAEYWRVKEAIVGS